MIKNYITFQGEGKKFDVLKILLAVMVVAIHTKPLPVIFTPILRTAVPLFFIMTSYFLFLKLGKLPENEQKSYLIRFVIRNMKLYLFWFVLLLPLTIIIRKWYMMTPTDFIPYFFRHFLFGSTFKASWFIMASVIGCVLVFFLSKVIKDWVLLVIGFLLYSFCCFSSSYHAILLHTSSLKSVNDAIKIFISTPYNSFMMSFLWIIIAKMIVNHHVFMRNYKITIGAIFSILLLYVEYYLVTELNLMKCNDCFFSLIPLSVSVFILIGQNEFPLRSLNTTMHIRKISTITYCCHLTIATLMGIIFRPILSCLPNYSLFLLTFLLCLFISLIVFKFEQKKHFAWLRYSY